MANFIFESTKSNLIMGVLNFSSDTFDIVLLDDTILLTPESYYDKTVWSDIKTFEITGTNYSEKALTNIGFTQVDTDSDGNDDQKIYADDIVYVNSTISASCAVITKRVGASFSDSDLLVMAIDIRPDGTNPIQSTSSSLTVKLSDAGGGFLVVR